MKRDIDLIRLILLKLEAMKPDEYGKPIKIDGYDQNIVNYHAWYLDEEGFIDSTFIKVDQAPFGIAGVIPRRIKERGYEFLDAARNPNVWEKMRQAMKEKSLSLTLEVAQDVLKGYVTKKLNLDD